MQDINIGNRLVGDGYPAFIVAEIGINHNGDLDLAKKTIAAAHLAGADAVKFQNYKADDFVSSDRQLKYTYLSDGKPVEEAQYDMFKRYELPEGWLCELKAYADQIDISFHSTPTNQQGVADLVKLGVPVLKNGSDYLTNLPLIQSMGRTNLPTVLSTGMATYAEIAEAVEAFRQTGNNQLILLVCTSCYPTPPAQINLNRLPELRKSFNCLCGFSDHSEGETAAIASAAFSACWIEKHFTLDKSLPGPDHRFSADPPEFKQLSDAVRLVETQLGSPHIGPAKDEEQSRLDYRLSCVAIRPLPKGTVIQEIDIAFRRPGTGLPPKAVTSLIGKKTRQAISENALLELAHLES